MKYFFNHTNPCSWKHLQKETPYSDIYVLSKVLIHYFLLLIAWKLYITVLHFKLLNLPEIPFFFCQLCATLSFVYKNITWRFLLTVLSSIFCCSVWYFYCFPPSEKVTACSNHYNSFSTTRTSPYNSIPNYTMCKIHTQQNVWICSALLQTNLTSLVFLSQYQMYYAQKFLEIVTILGLWTRQQFSLFLTLLFSNVNA